MYPRFPAQCARELSGVSACLRTDSLGGSYQSLSTTFLRQHGTRVASATTSSAPCRTWQTCSAAAAPTGSLSEKEKCPRLGKVTVTKKKQCSRARNTALLYRQYTKFNINLSVAGLSGGDAEQLPLPRDASEQPVQAPPRATESHLILLLPNRAGPPRGACFKSGLY
jgi:hypothetical protein